MPRLEDLFSDFMAMNEEEQKAFIREYRNKRVLDLQEVTQYSINKKADKLTDKEKALLKALGITAKDLKTLKTFTELEEDDDDNLEDTDGI